jgi:hypothetical protein
MDTPPPSPATGKQWPRRLAWLAAALLLLGVFFMYTQPEFMMQMANQVWACF